MITTFNNKIYTPFSIVSVFQAHIPPTNQEKKLVELSGVYKAEGQRVYGGFYYDSLLDEQQTDYKLKLKVPANLRNQLPNNQVIQFVGFITRKVSNYGQIELQANISEIIDTRKKKITDKDLKEIEVLQRKRDIGYKNSDEFLRNKIYKNEMINIVFLIGDNAIVENDVYALFTSGRDQFNIICDRCNFNSVPALTAKVEKYKNSDQEIICLVRGGGGYLERFDDPDLASELIQLPKILISALGHTDDVTLVEKIADKSLPVPAALGHYLTSIVEESSESFANSKAKIISDTKQLISKQFEESINNLNQQITATTQIHQKELLAKNDIHSKEINALKNNLIQIEKNNTETEKLLQNYKEQNNANERNMERLRNLEKGQSKQVLYIIVAFVLGIIIAALFF